MSEEWRSVIGWEGLYEASSLGDVRSVPRLVAGGNGSRAVRGGRVLAQSVDEKGYRRVTLSRGARRYTRRVQRLVLEAFTGPRPYGLQCRHLDGNPSNNALANLTWGTAKENWADRYRHGTARRRTV